MKTYNVLECGVIADGVTLVTKKLQALFDRIGNEGGGEVRFPAGQYVLSTVYLRPNLHVVLEEGAEILGSLEVYDYHWDEVIDFPLYQDAAHSYFHLSLFVGIDCDNISISGPGTIDMRSVWEPADTRDNTWRGPKAITLLRCKNVELKEFRLLHATDLAIYFTACENVDIHHLFLKVYIDGISPDNSKHVKIHDCDIEAGDDGIVLKSSLNQNRRDFNYDIEIYHCRIMSRCNAIKFGTESNGGFININIHDIDIRNIRISGIAVETVDGALIENVRIKNIKMKNVNAPLFFHVGTRMRAPAYYPLGQMRNITIENVTATGPYVPYEIVPAYYKWWLVNDRKQYPWYYHGTAYVGIENPSEDNREGMIWQFTSNLCGLKDSPIENLTIKNIDFELDGGVETFNPDVPEEVKGYPEVMIYGKVLPASGLYFRYINGLTAENIKIRTIRPDVREGVVFEKINDLKYH